MSGTPRKGDVDLDRLEQVAKAGCSLCNGTGQRRLPALGRVVPCGIAHSADPIIGVPSSTLLALIERLREAEKDAGKWRHAVERSAEFAAGMPTPEAPIRCTDSWAEIGDQR